MRYHVIITKRNGDVIDQGDFNDRFEIRSWAAGRTKNYPAGEPRLCYNVKIYDGDELISSYAEI